MQNLAEHEVSLLKATIYISHYTLLTSLMNKHLLAFHPYYQIVYFPFSDKINSLAHVGSIQVGPL